MQTISGASQLRMHSRSVKRCEDAGGGEEKKKCATKAKKVDRHLLVASRSMTEDEISNQDTAREHQVKGLLGILPVT